MVVVMQSCNSFTICYCPDCNKADEGTTDEFSNYHFCQQQACGHSNVSTFFLLPCVIQLCTFKLLYKMKQVSFWHSFDWTLWLQLKGCVDESCCSRSLSSNNKCGQGIFVPQLFWTWDMCWIKHFMAISLVCGVWEWLQVMTPNPECVGLDTTLVDALHTMHDGKFLHLPVVDQGKILVLHFVIRS
jgi:hypothetical protein